MPPRFPPTFDGLKVIIPRRVWYTPDEYHSLWQSMTFPSVHLLVYDPPGFAGPHSERPFLYEETPGAAAHLPNKEVTVIGIRRLPLSRVSTDFGGGGKPSSSSSRQRHKPRVQTVDNLPWCRVVKRKTWNEDVKRNFLLGRPWGSPSEKHCRLCSQSGHNQRSCPIVHVDKAGAPLLSPAEKSVLQDKGQWNRYYFGGGSTRRHRPARSSNRLTNVLRETSSTS